MCSSISVSRIRKAALQVLFDANEEDARYRDIINKAEKGERIARGIGIEDGLYDRIMQPVERKAQTQVLLTTVDQRRIWHERLRHDSLNKIEKSLRTVKRY